ncbi:MAG TPA: serine hydrolase domain-containing protein [Acidimicrobiales bacterium]|nr:serine hydrolase domain-containing protein [Acidimicrobiales bacterium]
MRVPDLSEIEPIFKEFTEKGPGCCLGIYVDGQVVLAQGFGLANLEHRVPITPDTVFDLASTSKQFTAASVLLLAEDGALGLDDDVRKYFPEFVLDQAITIRQLINHTSGLREIYSLAAMVGWTWPELMEDDQVVALLAKTRTLNFEPGTAHSYSNSGYVLLSALVKRVSGKSLADFAKERIFDPLGMGVTHYRDDITSVVPNRANGYGKSPKGEEYKLNESPSNITGDGAAQTTIHDLAGWESNFVRPVIGNESFRKNQLATAELPDGADTGYAAGLFVAKYKGLPSVSHGGAWAGFRSDYVRFPESGLAVAVFANLAGANPSALAHRVADLCLADEIDAAAGRKANSSEAGDAVDGSAPSAEEPTHELAEVTAAVCEGLYGDGASFVRIVTEGDGLIVHAAGMELSATRATPGVFTTSALGLTLAFTGTAGEPEGIVVKQGEQVVWTLPRVAETKVSDEEAQELDGEYRCDEVEGTWNVVATSAGVRIDRTPPREPLEFTFGPTDVLLGPGFNVSIERAKDGTPVALLASDSRAKGLRFERVPS